MTGFLRNFLEPFCYLVYCLVFLLAYNTHASKVRRALSIFYGLSTVAIAYACLVALDYDDNNNWIYNIHYFCYAGMLGYYFDTRFEARAQKIALRFLTGLTLLFFLVTDFISHPFFNSLGNAFFYLFVVICCLMYFRNVLNKVTEDNILNDFNFWLVSGYIIYFLGSFFIILTYNYLTGRVSEEGKVILADLWSIQNMLLLISALVALFGHVWITYLKKSR